MIFTGFMVVRQTYTGIDGWHVSGQDDGFMYGQCPIFKAGAYRTPAPNTSHRLVPDIDCIPYLL